MPDGMDISYYTINQRRRRAAHVCWWTVISRAIAYLGGAHVGTTCVGKSGGRALPELLAPAGGLDAMLAAVAAGADAIYAGLGGFNARVSAQGFTDEEFARGCAVAHAHGVRVYVTLNVFVFDGEIEAAVSLGRRAIDLGADALIVADLGLIRALRSEIPGVEVHLSTQAGVHAPEAVELAADELGVQRVTTARELTVAEIAGLCATGVPIEVFCHGAICIAYSGACEFSALRRGRSAMRGDCTQPCRLAYDLVDEAGESRVAVEGDRLLCPRDYLGLAHLPELVRAGVASLKIEGRMKNPDYVYNVVSVWRQALDVLAAGAWSAELAERLTRELGRSFNRGFTDAYLRGRSGAELMSFERAINQGVRVGRLVEVGREEVLLELDAAVAAGDTLEIRFYPGPDAPADVPKRWPQVPCPVDAAAGERLRVRCKRKVNVGCEVYLIRSAGVLAATAAALEEMRAESAAVELGPSTDLGKIAPGVNGLGADAADPSRLGSCNSSKEGSPLATCPELTLAATPAEAEGLLRAGKEAGVYAWRLGDDEGWEPLLGRLTVVLDEVCRVDTRARTMALMRRAGRAVCRNLEQVALARDAGLPFDVAAPVFCANSVAAAVLRDLGAGRIYLPAELMGFEDAVEVGEPGARHIENDGRVSAREGCKDLLGSGALADAARVRPGTSSAASALATVDGVYPPIDAAAPELMVMEHCVLTAEGPCAGECASCPRRHSARYLVERDATRLHVAVDALGRTRIFIR